MRLAAESRPSRANRSPSIIVNQCICKCLPQRWQTHSFAKLTTFLYSLDFFQFVLHGLCYSVCSFDWNHSSSSIPFSSQASRRRLALFPPCPPGPPSGGPRMPYRPFFGRGGSPKLWGIFPVAAPRQISQFLSDFLEVSFAEMVACPALKTCTLLISRAGQFAQKLGSVMSGQPAGGAGSALLTRVMMDDTRLMTILYPGQRSL